MIPVFLQDCLVEEFKTLFGGFFRDSEGNPKDLNVFPQTLPATKYDDEENAPYLLVIIEEGEDTSEISPHICKISIAICVKDEGEDLTAYKDVSSIINKVYHHLITNRVFKDKFVVEHPINWWLYDGKTDENPFPYYLGGLETNWTIGKITEDPEEFL